jgi:hypothetical protein
MFKKCVCGSAVLLVLCLVHSSLAQQMGAWTFDEGSGTTAKDISGNGNNGRLIGGPTWVPGKFGKALKFDGVDDYVEIPHNASLLPPGNEETVSAWINAERLTGPNNEQWQGILSKGDAPRLYSLYTDNGGQNLHFSTGSTYVGTNSTGQVPLNVWVHVAVVVTGGQHHYYINGEPAGVGGSGVVLPAGSTSPFRIGNTFEANRNFKGMIDEVRLYDFALTPEQIKNVFNGNPPAFPKARKPSPADGAVGVPFPLLSWSGGEGAVMHDLYFGTGPDLTAADRIAPGVRQLMYYYQGELAPGATYYWRVDEITGTGVVTTGDVWKFTTVPTKAYAPSPADGAINVPRNSKLAWSPTLTALSHDVYLGTSRDDVAAGTGTTFQRNVAETSFDPGPLAGDKVFYWRIDEVGIGNEKTAGDVWQFRTLPQMQISDPNLVGWWELDETEGTFVLDSSGYDNHGSLRSSPLWVPGVIGGALKFDGTDDYVEVPDNPTLTAPGKATVALWLNAERHTGPGGSQWQGVLGKGGAPRLYNLYTESSQVLHFSTGPSGGYIGSLSTGTVPLNEWVHAAVVVDGKHIFYLNGQPAGEGGAGATVPGGGTTPLSIGQTGENNFFLGMLDDVRIYNRALTQAEIQEAMQGNPLRARDPQPARDAQVDIRTATALGWTAGKTAAKHDVYFGADKEAVKVADTSAPQYLGRQTATTYSLDGLIEFGGGAYSWRIDEVEADGVTIHKGTVWTFTVVAGFIVDDFESYNDVEGTDTRIYETWIDGYSDGSSGSIVGNMDPPFAERRIVHGGAQAMPMDYNNIASPYFSEAYREFSPVMDWTGNGVTDLSLWIRGNPAGMVEDPAGTYTVTANSGDVWNASDSFRFVYKTLNGDGAISAKVVSVTNTSNWAKAGVMIRESLDPASSYAFMFPTPDGRRAFQNRPSTGASALSAHSATAQVTLPFWVKMERKGNQFTAYYSTDGKTWIKQPANENTGADASTNPQSILTGNSVLIGLGVASNNGRAGLCTAVFSDVVVTGGASFQVAGIGSIDRGNDPDRLYLTVQDGSNKTVTVAHPDAGAVNVSAWTEWKIPLTDLKGVSLNKVKRLYIGVGNKTNPAPDGIGRIYIDDIRVIKP